MVKSKDLIFNPPSPEAAHLARTKTRTTVKFRITQAVRDAVGGAIDHHYEELMGHFRGGAITGNRVADMYKLADLMVAWESDSGRSALHSALANGVIKLNDIVKRIVPEMRREGYIIEAGVCLGNALVDLSVSGPSDAEVVQATEELHEVA